MSASLDRVVQASSSLPRELYIRPAAPLDRFVDLLWYYEGAQATHAFERLLPTGTTELVVNLADDQTLLYGDDGSTVETRGSAVVCGTQTRQFLIATASQRRVAGVHFRSALPIF